MTAATLGFLDPNTLLSAVGVIGMAAALFAETGLLIGFFLPGDSLLFTAGLLAAQTPPFAPLWVLLIVAPVAAFAGDQVGYLIGREAGPKVFTGRQSRFFKQSYVERSQLFFDKYGARTILLARFVPVVRTFAPVIAGVSRMHYRTFVAYNAIGGAAWGCGVLILGYLLGGIAFIRNNVEIILALIVVLSVVPIGVELLRARRRGATAGRAGDGQTDSGPADAGSVDPEPEPKGATSAR